MQAEVVKADQGVQIAERHADASVKKQPVMQHQLKFQQKQMQKQSRLMQMQKHQNNNGVAIGGAILVRTIKQKHIDLLLMLWVKKTLQHSK
jgi:hypothetical protein